MVNSTKDRVQGLYGNNIMYSKDDEDLLSKGAQGSRSSDHLGKEKQPAGGTICSRFKKYLHDELNLDGSMDSQGEGCQNRRESTGEGKGCEMVLYQGEDKKGEETMGLIAISKQQKIPETRQSSRIQEQVLKKYNILPQGETKKRAPEGNIHSSHNSFALLSNSKICNLVDCMGVSILPNKYDVVDIMRDWKEARHVLNRTRVVEPKNPTDFIQEEIIKVESEVPLLEWKENDFESESFTLVQSKKKKKSPY
jgi:hypothetical protein